MSRKLRASGPIWALGAMSGTSLDGVDAAMLQTDGHHILAFGASGYRPYSANERHVLQNALGLWAGAEVVAAEAILQTAHEEHLQSFEGIEIVGFHGQTLAHAPRTKGTLQIGDGATLAKTLQTPVVWDFRSADVELGGEGAPLAPFYHFALARHLKITDPVVFLNLGGVGNITWVDPRFDTPELPGALLAFDTGPANAPINDLMMTRFDKPFDQDGGVAAKGQVETGALELFLAEPYFSRIPPKSLDRNDFAEMVELVSELEDSDAAATLCGMCAASVVAALDHCPAPPSTVLVTGGGRKNPVIMEMLAASIDCTVQAVEEFGLDGDMLEAQAFAFLAVRVARGLPTSCPSTTGVRAAVGGGIVSYPEMSDI